MCYRGYQAGGVPILPFVDNIPGDSGPGVTKRSFRSGVGDFMGREEGEAPRELVRQRGVEPLEAANSWSFEPWLFRIIY